MRDLCCQYYCLFVFYAVHAWKSAAPHTCDKKREEREGKKVLSGKKRGGEFETSIVNEYVVISPKENNSLWKGHWIYCSLLSCVYTNRNVLLCDGILVAVIMVSPLPLPQLERVFVERKATKKGE